MDKYIFRKFDDVRQWIEDNKLARYSFRTSRASASEKRDNDFVFQYDTDSTPEENLRVLERRLEAHGGQHLYGVGFRNVNATVGGMVCEVEYGRDEEDSMKRFERFLNNRGVGFAQPQVDEAELERKITEKLEMKYKLDRMESERKEFEKEKAAFEAEKSSVVGALIDRFAPIADLYLQKKGLAKVAGTDVEAERIVPVSDENESENEENTGNDLPDDEAAQGYALLCRFRAVEPDYLQLLESVVTMAESGDSTYNMAKQFLMK